MKFFSIALPRFSFVLLFCSLHQFILSNAQHLHHKTCFYLYFTEIWTILFTFAKPNGLCQKNLHIFKLLIVLFMKWLKCQCSFNILYIYLYILNSINYLFINKDRYWHELIKIYYLQELDSYSTD